MEESKKCDFELLHDQYQQIKILQKLDIPVENNVTEPSTEMKTIIDLMIEKIDNLIAVHDSLYLRLLAMKTTLFYEQSKLLISLGEEALAQNILLIALDNVKDVISKSEIIFLAFRIINHYAYLLTKQSEFDKPRELLEFAESTYRKLKNVNSKISFYTSDDLFSPNKNLPPPTDTSNKLERLVTNNLQMLGFIYNKQELYDKFAEYHHEVLKRQLETHDGDVTMWATKSAKLASYFLSKNRFKEARHHLAAAIYVLYNHEKELKALESSDNTINKKLQISLQSFVAQIELLTYLLFFYRWEELQQRFADVAKCWVKYGLFLFSVSKTNIVSHLCGEPSQLLERLWTLPFKDDNKKTNEPGILSKNANITDKETDLCQEGIGDRNYESPELTVLGVNPASESIPKSTGNVQQPESNRPENLNAEEYQGPFLVFESLKLIEYEEQVTASYIETTAQARDLFIYTHSWLKRAKTFYTLRDHPMEYINAILDLSELYRYLAFYEEDIESQYAVQKLRADALETLSAVLKEVRPQCYMAVSVELLRELAEVQLEMMGLNLRRIYSAQESLPETSDMTLHQMDALADIHSRLEQFGDHIGHNVDSGDTGLMPISEMAGDVGQYVNQ